MKTRMIIAALALSAALLSCQKEEIVPASKDALKTTVSDNSASTPTGVTVNVRYIVNVHFTSEAPLCESYQVEILNGAGVLMAPAQPFIPGKTTYYFAEQTRQVHGIRVARIEPASVPDGIECRNKLYTPPDILWIEFENNASYTFELTPQTNPPKPS